MISCQRNIVLVVRKSSRRYNELKNFFGRFRQTKYKKEDSLMKIDMHCHVKEGSIDSKVGLDEYITILKKHGFQGMVITDHDTYNGYRYW